jgi:hypothetical protein
MTKSYVSSYVNRLESIDHTIKGDFPVDFDLLFDIMYQQSPTYQPEMERLKKDWLVELISKIEGVTVVEKGGNIYCTKGEAEFYPTIVGHYDTAQDYHVGMRIFKTDQWIFGFDDATGEQCGLGLDDSVGVCFAIQMLKMMPVCKVFLPYGEERGIVGTNCCDMSFFDNSLVVTQLDRRSYTNDFIKFTNGVQTFSHDHYELIQPLMEKYGYTLNSGTATDVGGLRKRGLKVSSHNLSCGYFNEHSDTEIASVGLLINAFSFAYEMLTMLAERNIPLTFPTYSRSELPYGGSKVKSTSIPLGYGGRQIHMFDADDDNDWYYDAVVGDWVESKSKIKDPFEQSASTGSNVRKQSTYWSREMPSEMIDEAELEKDKEYETYNEWIMECYPEYTDPKIREELKSYSVFFPTIKEISQDLLDEMIMDDICPHCYDESGLVITNDLLLHTCCHACESVFNVVAEDQDYVESKIKECVERKIDFQEIADM